LLEGIGAIKEADKKRSNYQDSVIAPLGWEFDDDAVGLEDQPEELREDRSSDQVVLPSAIEKVGSSVFFIQFNILPYYIIPM
jgi:hypothetical protein